MSEPVGVIAHIDHGKTSVTNALLMVLDWAERRCPCHDEKPDPCPLCGASAKLGGGHCMSAENTLPKHILSELRAVRHLARTRP
jgi:hypothetical protein